MVEIMWRDGICKSCGSIVIEKPSDEEKKDYMNRCTNNTCRNRDWHYCSDDEQLDYYIHGGFKNESRN